VFVHCCKAPKALKIKLKPQYYSDEILVKEIVFNNDAKLFEILYDRYFPFVYGQCLSYFKNTEDAEDISQDIFFKLFLKLNTFKFKSKFFTWLYRFVHNHCINYKRSHKHKILENKNVNLERMSSQFLCYHYSGNQNENQKILQLNQALLLLSKHEQEMILFKYCNHGTIKEMAENYNCSESAVKMRLKRLKQKLINLYQQLENKVL
tara:strand:+ start:2675 stop:3295 length:621 start_codon:yes stop_codon:yes gene_type:complete